METKRKHPEKYDEEEETSRMKVQKLENVSSMGMFDLLCEELKELIFDKLTGKDLISLASCNKALNENVGNKSRYMKKIAYRVTKASSKSRKYEHLIFNENLSEMELQSVFYYDGIKERTKSIVFDCILTADHYFVLNSFKNIESLKIEWISNFDGKNLFLDLPSLKSLVIKFANNTLSLFAKCQLKNLEIYQFSDAINEWNLEKLLMDQRKLERLHLDLQDLFFYDYSTLAYTPFKLSELSLTYQKLDFKYEGFETLTNFTGFINNHRETLKTLRCTTIKMLNYFSSFENLQNVEITRYKGNARGIAFNMGQTSRFIQVQKLDLKRAKSCLSLKFCFHNLKAIEENFPNLQELSIHSGLLNGENIFSALSNLKKLTLIETEIDSMLLIPTVGDLKFIKCKFTSQETPFDFSHGNIQKLTIHQCAGIQWVHAFLKHPHTNLSTFDASPSVEFEEYAKGDNIKTFIRN